MRRITIDARITSPVEKMLAKLHHSITNVAKEKEQAFGDAYKDFDLTYVQSDEFIACVNIRTKTIFISTFVLEFLWITSWVLIRFCDYLAGKNAFDTRTVDVNDLSADFLGMQWAYNKLLKNKVFSSWPDQIPLPVCDIEPKSDPSYYDLCLLRTRDTTMSAFAFYFHHEMAHIGLLHNPKSEFSVEQERDADREAARFFFEDVDLDDANDWRVYRRFIGVAIGMNALVSKGIYTRYFNGDTHPRSFDRMNWIFDEYVHDENHPIYAFLVATLKLHIQLGMKEYQETEFKDSWKEKLEEYMDLFADKWKEWNENSK